MKTWNEIMCEPGDPEERLLDLLGLWLDIMSLYDEVPIVQFSPGNYCAMPNENYQRAVYPISTSSIIKVPQTDTVTIRTSMIASIINQDTTNYQRIKTWSKIFNSALDREERAIIVRKYFYHENYSRISRMCGFSVRSYYRILNSAKKKMIHAYSLDIYDENGELMLTPMW